MSNVVIEHQNSQMNMYAIDTKGDAVLLESNGHFILMNTGASDEKNKVVNYVSDRINILKRNGKYKSFSLYLSNMDINSIGEVRDIFKNFTVDSLYIQDESIITKASNYSEDYENVYDNYEKILSYADKDKSEIVSLSKDKEVIFGDAKITVLGPIDTIEVDNYNQMSDYVNDSSLISLVTVGATKFLSTGNISATVEEKLVDYYEDNLQATIYKLSNFGNEKASDSHFLSYVKPDYSIKTYIGEKKESYVNDAVKRAMVYSPVYSTEYNGDIIIRIKNDDVSISMDKNKAKVKVSYIDEDYAKLSSKVYSISKNNTLNEYWDFFIKEIDGYKIDDVAYSKNLKNITSSSYGVSTFKGIENFEGSIELTVTYNKVLAEKIALNTKEVKLALDDTMDVHALVEPENAKVSQFIWESDNEKVATVDDGKITAHSRGKAMITVRLKDSSVKASCTVIVGDYDSSIDGINLNVKNLLIDQRVTLHLNDFESDAIQWSVSDPSVLEISEDGVLTPLKSGITVITAHFNGYSDRCKVTVTDGLLISNIGGFTNVSEAIDTLNIENARILGSFGKYKLDNEYVATDDALVVRSGKDVSVYTISVIGDINGEGQVDQDDLYMLDEYLKGNRKLNKAALRAADVNRDGRVSKVDKTILDNYIKHKKGYETLPYKK